MTEPTSLPKSWASWTRQFQSTSRLQETSLRMPEACLESTPERHRSTVNAQATGTSKTTWARVRSLQHAAQWLELHLAAWTRSLVLWRTGSALRLVPATHCHHARTLESLGFMIKGGNILCVLDAPLVGQRWGLMTDGVVTVVGCWMILCCAYHQLAPILTSQAEGYARVSYRICIGEDETFDSTYSRLSHQVDGFLVTTM